MLIPLVAAEQFGVASLARTMAIILPADTLGQACFPYLVAELRQHFGDYEAPLISVFVLALIGAIAVLLLPGSRKDSKPLPPHAGEHSTR